MKRSVKFLVRGILVLVVIAVLFGGSTFLVNLLTGPKPIEVTSGWQELEKIKGIIPKGGFVVVADSSNLVFPGDSGDGEVKGFAKEGVIYFTKEDYCISEGSIWVYIPEGYEVLTKLEDFLPQCNEKITELKGGKGSEFTVKSVYLN